MSNEISNEDIKEFVRLAVESGVAEIEVQRGDNRVRIRRTPDAHAPPPLPAQPAAVRASEVQIAPAPPPPATAPPSNDYIVKSPIVGTYYDQANPSSPPFVRVGDTVEPGQVLCIIESMKLMNEIESEVSGVVVNKLMESGRPVEYGEALFTIRPR